MGQARTAEADRRPPAEIPHWQERVELAAAFRWAARLNYHEAVANHFSLAVSADGARFLMNPNGRHFARMRARDLLLLDARDAATMARPDAPDPTAWDIHGAIHRLLPHGRCVLHVHSRFATVLACLSDSSMPPIDQNTMRFYGRIAIDEGFDGMGLGEEGERLARAVGDREVLVMGNHGVLVVGASVARAFDTLYYFERASETLITAYMTGRPLRVAADAVARKTAAQWAAYPADYAENHFRELMAILDEQEPDYRS